MQVPVWQRFGLGVTIAGCIGLVWWAGARTNYPVHNAPVAGKKIVAFGDDLIAGFGATTTGGFIPLVSSIIRRPIVNAGIPEDTTATALARLNPLLDRERPDLVIVQCGGNDILQGMPMQQTISNLESIITRIQERGAAVLLLNIRGGISNDPYRSALSRLARKTHVAYLTNVMDDIWGNPYVMADPVHPNGRGYGIMAVRVAQAVEDLLRPPQQPPNNG
ncbi:MAG: GDSL-type esterase/lipase family protein [Patescibacteria group bacterium]|nr:GDSL-type esterase/lipase family protein [Patescibacteria group bacterium]